MEKTIITYHEIQPTNLTLEEIKDPAIVITRLFDHYSSEHLKKDLWELLKASTGDFCWTYLNEPGTAPALLKHLGRILDSLWLLLKHQEDQNGVIVAPYYLPGSEDQNLRERNELVYLIPVLNLYKGRVRRLSQAEADEPYMAAKLFFKYKSIKEWKDILGCWVEYALSKTSVIETYDNHNFLLEYEYLDKMIEVAYLFNKEKEKFYYNDEEEYLDQLIQQLNKDGKNIMTKTLISTFYSFLQNVPPERLNRNLRKMLFDFLRFNKGGLPEDFDDLLIDLQDLMELLDIAQKEIKAWT